VIPGTSSFYGNWIKDVRVDQFIILGNLLLFFRPLAQSRRL